MSEVPSGYWVLMGEQRTCLFSTAIFGPLLFSAPPPSTFFRYRRPRMLKILGAAQASYYFRIVQKVGTTAKDQMCPQRENEFCCLAVRCEQKASNQQIRMVETCH